MKSGLNTIAIACLAVTTAACGASSSTTTLLLPILNVSLDQNYGFFNVSPLIEGGAFSAISAVNASKKMYKGYTVQALQKPGTGDAIDGNPKDTEAEEATAKAAVAQSNAKILIGPPSWASVVTSSGVNARHWCTSEQILCISHAADSVRSDASDTFSFTTAGFSPGWVRGTAYDIAHRNFKTVALVADWDTTLEVPNLEAYGLTVTVVQVPGTAASQWASNGNDSPAQVATRLRELNVDAILLDGETDGSTAIYQALQQQGYTQNSHVWVGSQSDMSDFLNAVGNVAAQGVNSVINLFANRDHESYKAFVDQYAAWNNNPPAENGTWEIEAYWATLLGIYAIQADLVAQKGTNKTVLSGPSLREALLKLTTPSADSTHYYVSDVGNILKAIGDGKKVAIEGFGLPFLFADDGRAEAPVEKGVCCSAPGKLTTSIIDAETVLKAAH